MAKCLAEAHGGTLETNTTEGITFTLTLPGKSNGG
jgi:signal transduction histidine kinase